LAAHIHETMKKPALLLGIVWILFLALPGFSGDKFANWPQIKDFHTVMSQTFHPSETGDLGPIRKRSGEMVEKANALAKAEIPKEFKNKDVEAAVKKLATDAQSLHDMIQKKAGDEEVKKALAALHDTFHTIVEKCQPGDHHHHDHEGHEGHGH
jgi:hypothetical protein